jgi:hypothetical protein
MSVELNRERQLVFLRQQRHIEKGVDTAGLNEAWPTRIPMITGFYRHPSWLVCF